MSGAYEGRQIVGIDLHRRWSVLVRMSETGERLETQRKVTGLTATIGTWSNSGTRRWPTPTPSPPCKSRRGAPPTEG